MQVLCHMICFFHVNKWNEKCSRSKTRPFYALHKMLLWKKMFLCHWFSKHRLANKLCIDDSLYTIVNQTNEIYIFFEFSLKDYKGTMKRMPLFEQQNSNIERRGWCSISKSPEMNDPITTNLTPWSCRGQMKVQLSGQQMEALMRLQQSLVLTRLCVLLQIIIVIKWCRVPCALVHCMKLALQYIKLINSYSEPQAVPNDQKDQ